MDTKDQQALDNIARYGCHIIHVLAEADLPPFTYSVGIQKTCGAPEIVVVGLAQSLAGTIINEYCTRVRKGGALAYGQFYSGFIEGFDCFLARASAHHYSEYFGWNLWLYQDSAFEVAQLIYPSTQGVWPWEAEASEGFRNWQVVLAETGWQDIAATALAYRLSL